MGKVKKSDLKYDYSWKAISGDDSKKICKPDSILFNKHEGYEVLYLINEFLEKYNTFDKFLTGVIEDMIYNKLPDKIRNRADVLKWIDENLPNECKMLLNIKL